MECVYCNNIFISSISLKTHQKNAKYCLQKQGYKINFECVACDKTFINKKQLQKHEYNCLNLKNQELIYKSNKIIELETRLSIYNNISEDIRKKNKSQDTYINITNLYNFIFKIISKMIMPNKDNNSKYYENQLDIV